MSECIEWGGKLQPNGYGRTTRRKNGQSVSTGAHRVAWAEANGYDAFSIPHGYVLHHCDNRACVNPDHLYLGTHAQNMRDKVARDRCSRQFGDSNPNAKISASDAEAIRHRRNIQGEALSSIASDYGIGFRQVSKIALGHQRSERGEHKEQA